MLSQSRIPAALFSRVSNDDATLFISADNRVLALQYNGFTAEELDGTSIYPGALWYTLWSSDTHAEAVGALAQLRNGRRSRFIARLANAPDNAFWDIILTRSSPDKTCIATLRRVITEFTGYEATQTLLLSFNQALPGIMWSAQPNGELDTMSEESRTDWLSCIHPDQQAKVAQAWLMSRSTGTPYDVRFQKRFADDSYRWQHVLGIRYATLMEPLPIGSVSISTLKTNSGQFFNNAFLRH